MSTSTTADIARSFVEQNAPAGSGFWAKNDSLRNRVVAWLDSLETEAIERGVNDRSALSESHDVVQAIRNVDLDELVLRIESIANPRFLSQVQDPASLPNDVYAQWREQGGMNPHPGGLGVGLGDDIRYAAVSPRAMGSRRAGIFGPVTR